MADAPDEPHSEAELAGLQRLKGRARETPHSGDSEDRSAVEIQGLRVRYGDVEGLSGLDLTIDRGAVVALVGPNGAGKSTTINTLIGLKQPDEGRVVVAGRSPRIAVRQGSIGAMLQVSGLPSGAKVREVVQLAVALHRGRGADVDVLLASAGLQEIARREVTKLSGGQAQRVRFAIALAGTPEILFLDEPTVGMDVESRALFWKEVARYAEAGTTILFATHYLAEAERNADRVVMLAGGRLVADGTPTQLRSLYETEQTIQLSTREPDNFRGLELPGASAVEIEGDRVRIRTSDPDATMRFLYRSDLDIHDVSVEAPSLDDVFLTLAEKERGEQ